MVMLTLAYVTLSHHAFHDKKPDEEEEGGGGYQPRRGGRFQERGFSVVSRRLNCQIIRDGGEQKNTKIKKIKHQET